MSYCARCVQKSAAFLSDIEATCTRRKADSGPRQQGNSHVPLSGDDENVFPTVGLQPRWTAASSSCWLLGEPCFGSGFWSCNRHQHNLCLLPLKLNQVNSVDLYMPLQPSVIVYDYGLCIWILSYFYINGCSDLISCYFSWMLKNLLKTQVWCKVLSSNCTAINRMQKRFLSFCKSFVHSFVLCILRPVMSLIGPSKPTLVVRFCPRLFELRKISRRVPLKSSGSICCCFDVLHSFCLNYIIVSTIGPSSG